MSEYKQTTYGKVRRARIKRRPRPYNKQRPSNEASSKTTGQVTTSGFSIRSMPFFGYKIDKKVPYYSFGSITSGISAANGYVFSANGLFDPDITSTGGQPMSFDQAMLFFNHYTVRRSSIKVVFQTNSTNLRASVGLFVSGSSSITTNVEQLLENGDGAFQVLEYAGAFGGTATFSRSLAMGAFQTVGDLMDNPSMSGDSASNPAEQSYYHLVAWNPASATTLSVDFQVMITYEVTFHEPRKGPIS